LLSRTQTQLYTRREICQGSANSFFSLTIYDKQVIHILNIYRINKANIDDCTSARICNLRHFDETGEAWL
jgi:hypothetical protein